MRKVIKKKIPKSVIPNSVTAMNMFFGYVAVTYAFKGEFTVTIWAIYFAMFLDVLDGRLARLLNVHSRFGIEMDSLADLVTFGIAPSILMYKAYFNEWGLLGIAISFMPALFSAFRLARFNIDWNKPESSSFTGVPTPASAMFLIGFIAFMYEIWGEYRYPGLAVFLVIVISLLMVSNVSYASNKISRPRDFSQSWKIIPFTLSIVSVILYGAPAMFIWAGIYVLSGPIRWMIEEWEERRAAEASA